MRQGWHRRFRPVAAELSDEDLVILRLIAAGETNDAAGHALGVKEAAVRKRCLRIRECLNAQTMTHAVALMDDYRPGWRARLPYPLWAVA